MAAKWVALGGWLAAIGTLAVITVWGVAGRHPEKARAWQILPGLVFLAPVAYFAAYAPAFWIMHQSFSLAAVAQAQVNAWRFHHGFVGARWAGSPWYSWPLKLFPQYLILERERSVVLLGNPVVMWGGLAGLLECLGRLVRRFGCPTSAAVSRCGHLLPELIVALAYAGLLLQWSAAPARTTFYYYYLPAALALGPVLAVAFAESQARQWRVFGVGLPRFMLLAAAAAFVLAYPFMAAVRLPGAWFPK
jgi:dolichyl-phosphate-mannose--protein O-mannosyl transferase